MFPVSTFRTAYTHAKDTHLSALLPLAGGLAGLVGLGTYWLGTMLFPPPSLPILLSMAAVAGLTQAGPESGFATSISGSANNRTPASHALTGGLFWLILLVLARFFALQSLFANETFGLTVALKYVMAHSLSHLMATSVSWSLSPGGTRSTPPMSTMSKVFAMLTGLLPLLILVGLTTLWIYVLFLLPLLLLRSWLVGRLRRDPDGYPGPYLGTVQQLSELVVYLSFVSLVWVSI